MTAKFLKSLVVAILFSSLLSARAAPNPTEGIWADSPVGKCYSSLEQYLTNVFGSDYRNDENIQVSNAFDGSKQYKWVRDITPGINITRVLFKLEKDHRACAILFIPFASTVQEIRDGNLTELPAKFLALDSPPPGFPNTEILYQFDVKTNTYYPQRCLRFFSTREKRQINCGSVFQ